MGSRSGSANGLSAAANGGLADLVADAERERVTNQAAPAAGNPSPTTPPPPASGRMLRVEVHGLLHDWFDVGDMGDFIRSPSFAGTLRENVSRYFGVPLERQAIYDEDGLLTTCADFSRALQRVYPKLYVYDLEEMGPELRARAVEELRQLDAEIEQSWRHFGAGGSPPSRSAGTSNGVLERASNGTGPASDAPARSLEGAGTSTVERSYVEGGSGGTGWQLAVDQATAPGSQVCKVSVEQASDQATTPQKPALYSVRESDLAPRVIPASAYVKPCDDFSTIRDISTGFVAGPPDETEVRICSTPLRNAASTEALGIRHVAPLAAMGSPGGALQATPMQGGSERFLDAGYMGGGVRLSAAPAHGYVAAAATCLGEMHRSASGRLLMQQGQPMPAVPVSTPGPCSNVEGPVRIITPSQHLQVISSQPGTPRAGTTRNLLQQISTPVQVRAESRMLDQSPRSYPLGVMNGMGGTPQALYAQTPPRSQTPARSPRRLPGGQPQLQQQQLLQQQPQLQQKQQQLQQPSLQLQAPNVQLQLSAAWQAPLGGLSAPAGLNFNFQPHLPQLHAGFNSMQVGGPPVGPVAVSINRGNSTPGVPLGAMAAPAGTVSPGVPMGVAMHGVSCGAVSCGTASPRIALRAASPCVPPGSGFPAMITPAETRSPRRQES